MNAMLITSDQVIFQNNECELQRSMLYLQQVYSNYNMNISMYKMKTTTFVGKYLLRIMVVIYNKSIKLVLNFRNLGCDNTYDVGHKMSKFHSIWGTIRPV